MPKYETNTFLKQPVIANVNAELYCVHKNVLYVKTKPMKQVDRNCAKNNGFRQCSKL